MTLKFLFALKKGGLRGPTIIFWDWLNCVRIFFMFLVQKGKQKKID